MKKRNIVKQNYHLVNAKYKLNTSEIKFIMTALAQIDTDDTEFKEYEIKVSELEAKLQVKKNETHLKQFAKKILSKPLEVSTNDGWIVFNWFSDIEYVNGQSKFKVSISKKLKPYLLELKKRFVKYNLKYILPLSSNYSIRIYQLLKEYEKLTRRTFTVEELQDILQVPKSLIRYSQFKQKILKVAEKELIEHCDIFFEYEEIKKGRKVNEILFRIKPNKPVLASQTSDTNYNKYSKYYGRTVTTAQGKKIVLYIQKNDAGFLIKYTDGAFSKLFLHSELKYVFGEIDKDELVTFSELKRILEKKKLSKLTKREADIIKKYIAGVL